MDDRPLIILTAAEASGDQHAAHLARAILARLPRARLVGFGGPRMAGAGVELLADLTSRSAMLLLGSLGRVPEMLAHYLRFDRFVERNPVALHIPVDSPVVNLPLAGRSKWHAVPVLYYIAPQLWAWGAWRTDRLRRRVDRLACILPFEPDYFAARGVAATFVGHPLFEPLVDFQPDAEFIARELPSGSPRIALLPGSRGHEIVAHLPAQLRAAAAVRRSHPGAAFVVAAPAALHGHSLDLGRLISGADPPVALATGRLHDVLSWADAALTVSGSVTLEAAWFGVPMAVMYHVSPRQWRLIGRRLVKSPFMSLPNILAGRELVAELMPWFGDDEPIVAALRRLIDDEAGRVRVGRELRDLVRPLAELPASQRTADLAMELLRQRAGRSEA